MTVPEVADRNNASQSDSFYYYSEFYDIYSTKYLIDPIDTKVYFDQLLASHRQPVVLDVATGTGRIIKGLIEHGARVGHDWSQTTLIGLDNSAPMLEEARKSIPATKVVNVTWTLGSAFDLEAALAGMAPPVSAVDLLILSFGSITHFTVEGQGQGQQFFNQVAKVLRPGSGRAAISFCDVFKKTGDPITLPGPQDTGRVPSQQRPGITYQEVLLENRTVGDVYRETREVTVRDGDSVVEQNKLTTEYGLWTEDMMKQMADAAGLRGLYQIVLPTQLIWIVERS